MKIKAKASEYQGPKDLGLSNLSKKYIQVSIVEFCCEIAAAKWDEYIGFGEDWGDNMAEPNGAEAVTIASPVHNAFYEENSYYDAISYCPYCGAKIEILEAE